MEWWLNPLDMVFKIVAKDDQIKAKNINYGFKMFTYNYFPSLANLGRK
jgi:hypothetical protein